MASLASLDLDTAADLDAARERLYEMLDAPHVEGLPAKKKRAEWLEGQYALIESLKKELSESPNGSVVATVADTLTGEAA